MASRLWVWVSFIQTQVFVYLDAIDRKWLHRKSVDIISDDPIDFQKVNSGSKGTEIDDNNNQTNTILSSTFDLANIPFLGIIEWDSVVKEATQVGVLVSAFSQWVILSCGDSIKTMLNAQFVNNSEQSPE